MPTISSIYVKPTGPDGASIAIIGEAPGSDETRLKQPFVGRSGSLLRQILQVNGLSCASSDECEANGAKVNDSGDIKFLNLCNYQPSDNNFGYLEGSSELKEGISFIQGYLKQFPPKLVILLGAKPLEFLAGKYGISKWRGSIIERDGILYLPSFHPSYILRDRSSYPILSADISRAARILKEGFKLPKYNFSINPQGFDFEDCLDELKTAITISVDIETVKNTNRILCCGVASSRSRAICIPNRESSGLDPEFRRFFTELLENRAESFKETNRKRRIIFHNGLYDIEILKNNGIDVKNFTFDTMVAQHVLAPELPKGLDFITSIYTDIPYYKDKGRMALPENEKGWGKIKEEEKLTIYEYNCLDCVATFWCYEEMLVELEQDSNLISIFNYEMSLHDLSFHLTRSGMLVDKERQNKLREIVEAKYTADSRVLSAIVGHPFNEGSPAQKKKLLYEEWSLPTRTNKESAVSTDEDALVSLIAYTKDYMQNLKTEAKKYEWQKKLAGINLILKLQGYRKLLSSYIDIEPHDDGRIRSVYKITGTETGRWSCSKYYDDTGWNAQTLPRESIEG